MSDYVTWLDAGTTSMWRYEQRYEHKPVKVRKWGAKRRRKSVTPPASAPWEDRVVRRLLGEDGTVDA